MDDIRLYSLNITFQYLFVKISKKQFKTCTAILYLLHTQMRIYIASIMVVIVANFAPHLGQGIDLVERTC